MEPPQPSPSPNTRRVIKRYSNRKLYDTKQSRYVTLLEIAEMVRAGEDVQVVDNSTKEDKTDVTLALIISEELKSRPRGIPLATLKALIRHRGGRLLMTLREGPMGRFIPPDIDLEGRAGDPEVSGHAGPDFPTRSPSTRPASESEREAQRGLFGAIEHWQHIVDERVRSVLTNYTTIRELQAKVAELSTRVAQLEARLDKQPGSDRSTE